MLLFIISINILIDKHYITKNVICSFTPFINANSITVLLEWVGNDAKMIISPHRCGGGGNLCKWKSWGLQIIVTGLESGGARLKDRMESEGEALREDGEWGSSFPKVTIKKERNVIWLQTWPFFSFALMIIFDFHANNSVFSKCFPKKGRNKIIVLPPPFSTLLESGAYALYPQPLRPGKGV